ncbi:hypothetical protein N0V90_005908 [Kalmusia sp. IMI 367209]|nr:hypothetical protein N0V90_005908 [Kalmusia sp. IMI 367209]
MNLSFLIVIAAMARSVLSRVVSSSLGANDTLKSAEFRFIRGFDSVTLADDEKWTITRCKGAKLVALMLATDQKAGPQIEELKGRNPPSAKSAWQGDLKAELATWGWSEFRVENIYADMEYWQVESVIKALNINGKPKADGGKIIPYQIEHWNPNKKDPQGKPMDKKDQTYKVNGREYRSTAARHVFCVNPTEGVIFGQFLLSPPSAAEANWRRKPAKEELPELRKLSDVFWGYWVRDNPNIANIQYFWMQDIANDDTEEIIARALHESKESIGVWPGVTFDIDTDAGNAILGSQNGAPFAWFLIQHKEQLGSKWIPKVTVFINDSGSKYTGAHLIFYVDTVPVSERDDSDRKISDEGYASGGGKGKRL